MEIWRQKNFPLGALPEGQQYTDEESRAYDRKGWRSKLSVLTSWSCRSLLPQPPGPGTPGFGKASGLRCSTHPGGAS